ncbi:hypothetical protein ACQP08_09595 [Micromonospora zamorensis]|uniref:hypothetical protein n=1 Tax=Micromonospora zamorensis TaxID=709883 RepID=UPI003D8A4A0B
MEDLSHNGIDVEFAALAYQHKLAYRRNDLARLARTYSRNLATTTTTGAATTFLRADGMGGLATSDQFLQALRWMPFAGWDSAVFAHSRAVYDVNAVEPQSGSLLLCVPTSTGSPAALPEFDQRRPAAALRHAPWLADAPMPGAVGSGVEAGGAGLRVRC